jgi:uncharacterized membrane protein
MTGTVNRRPLIAAGLVLGVGMGGFVDGILFHQILQWHNMVSAKYPTAGSVPLTDQDVLTLRRNVEVNMFWDGMFHAFTWAMNAVGLYMLFEAARRPEVPWSRRTLVGSMLLGFGLFNLLEGVVDHHVLHLHHVREDLGVSVWDYGFLASGVVLMLAGWGLISTAKEDAPAAAGAANLRPAMG